MHAARLPVRVRTAELTELGGVSPAVQPAWCASGRHPQRRCGEKRFVHEQGLDVFDMRYVDEWACVRPWNRHSRASTTIPTCT